MLTLGESGLLDQPRLRVRLGHDDLGLAACLVFQLQRTPLRRDERLPQERLEVAVARDVALHLLELVLQLTAFAPCFLEALDDLVQQGVHGSLAVAEEALAQVHVTDFDR